MDRPGARPVQVEDGDVGGHPGHQSAPSGQAESIRDVRGEAAHGFLEAAREHARVVDVADDLLAEPDLTLREREQPELVVEMVVEVAGLDRRGLEVLPVLVLLAAAADVEAVEDDLFPVDIVPEGPCTTAQASAIFDKARRKQALSAAESDALRWRLLHDLAVLDHGRGWVMQLHIGALRSVNTRMLAALGPNTGFDSIGDAPIAGPLARWLDAVDQQNRLPRTIFYNLNPRDNEMIATMAGNFQDGSVPGKMQYGSAWWFLDQLDGMEKQMNALSNMGLLSRFVGMLTDSRSFLSYSRHEYFRRLLCNMLGNDVRRGLVPDDAALLSGLVKAVCFNNAREYFGFDV